ncbi:MAG TPA: hypothetical protein VFR01_06600, partial [Geobacterales bacterium]|nr:hypothetical protein [Geobacterales bacterium]
EKMARILNDENYGKLPQLAAANPQTRRVFKSSFAQPPQMWSTHPASVDREENAKRLYLPATHDARSAWLLFDDLETVKGRVARQLVGEVKAEPATAEETLQALDERYAQLHYEPRYRGAYLNRPLTRHVTTPSELYEELLQDGDLQQALAALYPKELADELTRLRDLTEERTTLQALRDKVYQATGGRIVHRGREIPRRELPAAIRQVATEEEEVRQRIVAHDRRCRGAHLLAAQKLGGGWRHYLEGTIKVMHYAEHTLADLRDAHGLLCNVVAVVTADGKVSAKELKQLLSVANMLQSVLARIHGEKGTLQLDQPLCARLKVASWSEMLEEFKLGFASKENINSWMGVIDGWVDVTASPLSALYSASLEQLLVTEDEVARQLREHGTPTAAPAPSSTPTNYPALLSGKERPRQRLGLWDRFQTANGFLPATARLLVAGAIVGVVLGYGSITGTTSTVSVHNGLGRLVTVEVGKKQLTLTPFSSTDVDLQLDETTVITALARDGRVIERFTPALTGHTQHYVYNVASASPLVEWTAIYGEATERPPQFLGAPRWLTSSADVFFAEPPQTVKTEGKGATRTVLSGLGGEPPADALKLLKTEAERQRVIQAHATWDEEKRPNTQQWRDLVNNLNP